MKKLHTLMIGLRWVGAGFIMAIVLSAFTPLWNEIGEAWSVPQMIRQADAIVVLGAGILADGSLVTESLKRTTFGMQLYKRGLAPIIVFSGPPWREGVEPSEAEARKQLAIQMGIPE